MQKNITLIRFILLIILIVVAVLVVYDQNGTSVQPTSSFSVVTLVPTTLPTKAPEPLVTEWTTYKNDKYNFTLSVPSGWHQQEYIPPSGGLLVAFSPTNTLPCANCTYVHDGYFSIKIYNKTTDSQAYTDFTTRMQNLGKSPDLQGVILGGIRGVLAGNTVAVENHNWVYEMSLDTDNGNDKALASQIFQHTASSLEFTYIIFSN